MSNRGTLLLGTDVGTASSKAVPSDVAGLLQRADLERWVAYEPDLEPAPEGV